MLLLLLALTGTAQAQDWTTEDCALRAGAYHVVGSGATLEVARLKARESALLCVFGGDYESQTQITETDSTAKFGHTLGVTLSVTAVDWTGLTQENVQVSGHQAYVQYRWEERAAKASKATFERRREQAMRVKAERASHPGGVLNKIPCGTTFAEIVEVLGPPQEIGCETNAFHPELKAAKRATWGEFELTAESFGEQGTCEESFKSLAKVRVTWVTRGYGHGDTRWVCH